MAKPSYAHTKGDPGSEAPEIPGLPCAARGRREAQNSPFGLKHLRFFFRLPLRCSARLRGPEEPRHHGSLRIAGVEGGRIATMFGVAKRAVRWRWLLGSP